MFEKLQEYQRASEYSEQPGTDAAAFNTVADRGSDGGSLITPGRNLASQPETVPAGASMASDAAVETQEGSMMPSESNGFDEKDFPPFGKVLELDADKKAFSREAAAVEYLRIDGDPQLAPAFQALTTYTREFQDRYGLPVTEVDPGSVHVLTGENMGHVARLLELQEDNGAVYDTRAGITYVRAPERRDSEAALAHFSYAVSHELGHKVTSGLGRIYQPGDNSHVLREGIADIFARGYMHGVYLPNHAPKIDQALSGQFAQGQRLYELEGVLLDREDIFFVDPVTMYASGFSRIFETRAVYELGARLGTDAFAELMRRAAGPDARAVRQLIVAQCGIETWGLLTADAARVSPIDVMRELQR